MEPDNPALDDFVLGLAATPEPRLCLLPTAGGDSDDQIARFQAAFGDRPCHPTVLSLFRLGSNPMPLREHLLAQDVIYVGGGSMVNLLAIWRAQRLDAILREAWEHGTVLAGLSAGAMCWFEWGVTKSFGAPSITPGLGFLPGSLSVHYDGEPERRPLFKEAIRSGRIPGGWGADDGVGLLFRGTRLDEIVASRPLARAYRVARAGDEVVEDEVIPAALARPAHGQRAATSFAVAELRHLHEARRAAAGRGPRRPYGLE